MVGLHGSGGGFAGMAGPAGLLASHGMAVYVPHYFERTGTTEIADKMTIMRNFPAWMKTMWDCMSFVEKLPQTDPARIGGMGFSLGAYLVVASATIDQRIKAVVEISGGLPKEMKLFMRRLCPMLVLHGAEDGVVPVSEADHLQQVLEKKGVPYEMKIYPGAGHSLQGEVWVDAEARTLAFLKKHLA